MSNEIIEAQAVTNDLPAIADDQIIALAERAEKRIDAVNKLKKLALKVTSRYDWTDQQGRPYMQVSGAEKVARLFGVSWQLDEPVFEMEDSGNFSYTYKGTFSISGTTIEAIGTRSSKDGFFNRGGKLPLAEIDKGDLKKAAFTNCIGSGITRLLGIRNLTWEDLAEVGITPDNVQKIDYKKNGKTQDKHIASEGSQVSTFIPKDIRKQTGTNKKTNKPWTKFIVKSPADTDYGTFSETFAGLAKEAKEAGRQIAVTFKQTEWGNDIENLVFADDGPQEREAGQEG